MKPVGGSMPNGTDDLCTVEKSLLMARRLTGEVRHQGWSGSPVVRAA